MATPPHSILTMMCNLDKHFLDVKLSSYWNKIPLKITFYYHSLNLLISTYIPIEIFTREGVDFYIDFLFSKESYKFEVLLISWKESAIIGQVDIRSDDLWIIKFILKVTHAYIIYQVIVLFFLANSLYIHIWNTKKHSIEIHKKAKQLIIVNKFKIYNLILEWKKN